MNTSSFALLLGSLLTLTVPGRSTAEIARPGNSPKVVLSADLAHPLVPAGKKNLTYLKAGITGFDLEASAKRAPVNVSIVIDKSGSMSGDKIVHAREAAKQALDRLGANDRVSVIAYDDKVHVIAPATGVEDRESIKAAIDKIGASGSTALFAGVSKGAEELRKNKMPNQVNRVVLLSDGQANVGPQSPQMLGRLGASLSKEGITVTTLGLGLGYNEDLMTELALRSDGNHAFIRNSEELAAVFQSEFGDILSVVAQRISVKVHCAEGIRPVRVLGREADITGQDVTVTMNQLYAKQNKFVLLEVELPEGTAENDIPVADVKVTYVNALTAQEDEVASRSVARRSAEKDRIAQSVNKDVMVEVAKFISTEKEAVAVELSDKGDLAGAMKAYKDAAAYSDEQAKVLNAPELQKKSELQVQRQIMINEGGDSANAARKMSKDEKFKEATQNKGR